jgi:hypothetical protein
MMRGRALDRDMDDEMTFHLEMEAADAERGGLSPDEGDDAGRGVAFGGVERFREEGRDARGVGPARDLSETCGSAFASSDARPSLRSLLSERLRSALARTARSSRW